MINRTLLSSTVKKIIFPALLATFFLFLSTMATAELLDRVVAVVNEDIITLSELDEFGAEYLDKITKNSSKESLEQELEKARGKLLDVLVQQHLINQEATKAGVQISDKEFETIYTKKVQELNLSREQLLEKLDESGLSEESYRSNMRNELLREKLVLYEVRSKIIVTEKMIEDYYNTEYAKVSKGGGYYILQMGFTWQKTDKEKKSEISEVDIKIQTRRKAEEIRQKVIDGADFNLTAKEESDLPSATDGGDLGLFQEDEMAPYMRKAILSLKVGEISPILETPDNFQFFKLLSSKKGEIIHQVPLFSVKDEISKKLFDKKFREEFEEWVKGIKKGSYVKKMLL